MGKINFNFGYLLVLSFFLLNSIHFLSSSVFYFYKEIFFVLFLILLLKYYDFKKTLYVKSEFFYVFIFIFILILSYIFIPSRQLYGDEHLNKIAYNSSLYVIRNSIIYIPMLLYLYNRDINTNERLFLMKLISISSIISIYAYLYYYKIIDSGNFFQMILLGTSKIEYNSYIPYLTFPFITSLYIFFISKKNNTKLFFLSISILLFIFIFISTSRQSILFCLLVFLGFLYFEKKSYKKYIFPSVIIFLIYLYVSNTFFINQNIFEKVSSLSNFTSDETGRFFQWKYGLSLLTYRELIVGAGISSIIESGPHNDYIRWTQRVGLIGLIFSFLPFLIAIKGSFYLMLKNKNKYNIFVFFSVLFTLYISFFGYPREDAYQAPYVWLGLSFWILLNKSKK